MNNGHILILAAGASRRMRGADKLLEQVDGTPQLRRITGFATQTDWPVFVTLPDTSGPRAQALAGIPATLIRVPDHATGMSASLRAGADISAGPLMIVPADMPGLESSDLLALITAHLNAPDAIHCGASAGMRGHPVILPAWLVPELAHLNGDRGAKRLIETNKDKIRDLPLPGRRAILDLDTPEAWADWHASRQ